MEESRQSSTASGTVKLARRMLWDRENGKPTRPQPVIILLGPVGSGKTYALDTISDDLAWGVVHARFNFGQDQPVTTVEVLTQLAYDLSLKWRHRAKPQFVRFAIAVIALQAQLGGVSRERDRAELRNLINDFGQARWAHQLDNLVNNLLNPLVDAAQATTLLPQPFGALLKTTLPRLIRAVRPRLGKAMRSLADFPQAEGASPLDALVTLNRLGRGPSPDIKAITAWLTEAFLADVRENHRRMSNPEPKSPCDCANPDKVKHLHNWVLLLDDVDHPDGAGFLTDLTAARDAYLLQHPDDPHAHDALLVMATSGRWQGDWNVAWRPPWKPEPAVHDKLRAVPSCHTATYDRWAKPTAGLRLSPYYPVLLDTLQIGEIARILGTNSAAPKAALTYRATGGLPSAVKHLAAPLHERTVQQGARDVLNTENPDGDPWYFRLAELGLTDHLPDVRMDDFITAAPFATAPWLIPLSATNRINQPLVGRILTELRTAFWVNARDARGVTADHVTLHPWIATNLVSALAHRKNKTGPSYMGQFTALCDDPDTEKDPVRRAYCRLALGDISTVVTLFEQDFDRRQHQDWIDRLTMVVHAPDNLPLGQNYGELYEELVNIDIGQGPPERTEVRNNVARLVASSWLTANPFAVRGLNQNREIANAFESLARVSQLPDVSALHEAAEFARRGLLP
jgi:hypothetical protein